MRGPASTSLARMDRLHWSIRGIRKSLPRCSKIDHVEGSRKRAGNGSHERKVINDCKSSPAVPSINSIDCEAGDKDAERGFRPANCRLIGDEILWDAEMRFTDLWRISDLVTSH